MWAVGLLLLWALAATGAEIDAVAARGRAERFVQSRQSWMLMAPNADLRLAHIEASAAHPAMADYYVFNASDGTAFVIVAGDDRAVEILAYGDGTLDMDSLPCNVQCWLDGYRIQMEYLHAHPDVPRHQQHREQQDTLIIAPLVTARWDQTRPYNDQCPLLNGKHCVTGCVATAMAQVMYRWQFPPTAPALAGYTTSKNRITLPSLPQVELQWDKMLDAYIASNYTDEQAAAVATLMRYCGQSCKMDYGTSSGAMQVDELKGLKLFGYNPSATLLVRYNYSDADWEELLLEELQAGRPILYSGESSTGIHHAFVIDGYDGSRYHANWGWGGIANGYFAIDAFSTGYNFSQSMLYHVFPEGVEGIQPVYDVQAGGICYKKTRCGLRVVNAPGGYYGDVVIPERVDFQGENLPVTTIGPGAFSGSTGLTSVAIGAAVTTVGESAFEGCTGLKRVSIPPSVTLVRHQAFLGCTALDTVDITDFVAWCDLQFQGYDSSPLNYATLLRLNGEELTHVVIPDGMQALRNDLFRGVKSLVSVTLPNSVTQIGNYAFYKCTSLTDVQLGDSVESIGYCAFAGCKALPGVSLPSSLVMIDRYAFKDCEHLERIVIPDKVDLISSYSFYRCKRMTHVTLGCAVDSIASNAFMGCTSLDTIWSKAVLPPAIGRKNSFDSSNYTAAVLCVPQVSLHAYQSAQFWNRFTTVVGIDTSCGPADVNGDGEINIADLNALLDLILSLDAPPLAADLNTDGELNIADLNTLINLLLQN